LVDLEAEELVGGHTIERHVGKSEDALRQRLADDPRLRAASSFVDLAEAESAVDAALADNAGRIAAWLAGAGGQGRGADLALRWDAPRPLGRIVARAIGADRNTSRLRIVLRLMPFSDKRYMVLTAFPDVEGISHVG
jgi:hypothetical protein